MTKQLYRATIAFLGLGAIAGFLVNLLYFHVGINLLTQPSFPNLFLVITLITLVGGCLILRYFYQQHYWVAYTTGLFYTFISFSRAIQVYIQLVPFTRSLESYYIPVFFLEISCSILYAASLILSQTGKQPWLKAAGGYFLLLKLVTLAMLIWSLQAHPIQMSPILEKTDQWVSLIGCFLPVLFIRHFWQQQVNFIGTGSTLPAWQETLADASLFMAIGAFLFLGVSIFGEGVRASQPSPKAKQLTQLLEVRVYRNQQGDSLQYRLLKPLAYDSTRKYPLLVSLHGGAGYGIDNIRQLDNWEIQQLSKPENRKKYPAFVFAPQCPRGASWGGLPRLSSMDTLVFEAMKTLEQEFSIDTARRYVAGG
jgi:hypothetical protein